MHKPNKLELLTPTYTIIDPTQTHIHFHGEKSNERNKETGSCLPALDCFVSFFPSYKLASSSSGFVRLMNDYILVRMRSRPPYTPLLSGFFCSPFAPGLARPFSGCCLLGLFKAFPPSHSPFALLCCCRCRCRCRWLTPPCLGSATTTHTDTCTTYRRPSLLSLCPRSLSSPRCYYSRPLTLSVSK